MADLTKYPNPLRLFTQTRDEWFTELVKSFDVPMHIFSAIRDTQLGQLMFAIETMRMKRKRAGEDPGPGLLEGENATMFIPLFKLVKQFQDFLGHEDIETEADDLYDVLLPEENFSTLDDVHKTGQEWFTPLTDDRLDDLFITSTRVFQSGVIQPLLSHLEVETEEELKEKMTDLNEDFANTFFTIYSPDIAEAIDEKNYTTEETDQGKLRIYSIDDEEIELSFNELHGRTNTLYSFILELHRFIGDREGYDYDFPMLEPLLSLEMLIMFPQPDTDRLPLVKQHLTKLTKNTSVTSSFFDVLVQSYQSFSRIEDANARMVRKLFSTLEKTMKETSRAFWKQVKAKLAHDNHEQVESLIAIIWTHLRAIQSQAKHREEQSGHSHSQSHAITIRLEHIFWVQGRFYHDVDQYESPHQFWSGFAAIANKQVRSKEDSLDLFYELDNLLTTTEVLTDEDQQERLIVNNADRYSLIQRVMSYGLEARSEDPYDRIEEYLVILENLLDEIDEDEMHDGFDLEQERKVVDDIRTHMKNPISVNN